MKKYTFRVTHYLNLVNIISERKVLYKLYKDGTYFKRYSGNEICTCARERNLSNFMLLECFYLIEAKLSRKYCI